MLPLLARKKTSVLSDFFAPSPVFLASPLTQKPITFCVSEHSFFFLNEEKSSSRTVRNTSHYCQEMDTYSAAKKMALSLLPSVSSLMSIWKSLIFFATTFLHRCRYNSMIVVAKLAIVIPKKKIMNDTVLLVASFLRVHFSCHACENVNICLRSILDSRYRSAMTLMTVFCYFTAKELILFLEYDQMCHTLLVTGKICFLQSGGKVLITCELFSLSPIIFLGCAA